MFLEERKRLGTILILTHCFLLDFDFVARIVVGDFIFTRRSNCGTLYSSSGEDEQQYQGRHYGQSGYHRNYHQRSVVITRGGICASYR